MTEFATPADSSLAPHRDPTASQSDGKLLDGESTLIAGDLTFVVAPPTDRQTIEIIVERDASLQLKIPHGTTVERAERFIAKKRQWVYSKLSEKDALTGPPVVKQFVEGEGFAYLGRSYRLTLTDDPPGTRVRLERGRFHLPAVDAVVGDGPSAMRRWYIDTGGAWVRKRIHPWDARAGEPDVRLEVRDLGYRWGSARPTDAPRRVSLHWAALQMPSTLIDYILVHELAHLREANHTPDFWSVVSRLMPSYGSHKTTLASIGKTIWLGSVPDKP
ncbi:MAG: M48 family metallopeptidase [Acidimicrobiales bacterium]|nr:M48 family metallopeptidase [Acidimicrobiales bacterium]MYD81919.1 M48 family metallopeptidase [Acidimicrobiales bacterium]MYJ65261.1 M48 family metallopeptidase [Acidimicrobiales bacterium]